MTNLSNLDEIDMSTVKQIKYNEITNLDKWRIPIIIEAIDIKYGLVNFPEGWSDEKLNEVLHYAICNMHAQHSISAPLQLFLAGHVSPLTMQGFQPKNNPHRIVLIRKWFDFHHYS